MGVVYEFCETDEKAVRKIYPEDNGIFELNYKMCYCAFGDCYIPSPYSIYAVYNANEHLLPAIEELNSCFGNIKVEVILEFWAEYRRGAGYWKVDTTKNPENYKVLLKISIADSYTETSRFAIGLVFLTYLRYFDMNYQNICEKKGFLDSNPTYMNSVSEVNAKQYTSEWSISRFGCDEEDLLFLDRIQEMNKIFDGNQRVWHPGYDRTYIIKPGYRTHIGCIFKIIHDYLKKDSL